MSRLAALFDRFTERKDRPALDGPAGATTYGDLLRLADAWDERFAAAGDAPGAVVGWKTDFGADAVAGLLALLRRGNVVALVPASAPRHDSLLVESRAESLWRQDPSGEWLREAAAGDPEHPLLDRLRDGGSGGFVLFTSGSSGTPKAVLHDVERFLSKFDRAGKAMRTLAFLLFDHVAGQDTLFYTLAAGGCLVLPDSRDPARIGALLENHAVEVLPASPTFLKLFCLAGAHEDRDLTRLKIVTYGSEPMPPETLQRVGEAFPEARVVQKYGTSELGSPRSKSRERGSLWMSLKDDEVEAKVIDGILWLRSDAAMLGYLNAPNPIGEDGWWCTGDLVEIDGDWIRILGRESDVVNVGGEKVYPAQVEAVILELDWVVDCAVRGATHPITGQIVEAVLQLTAPRELRDVRKAVRAHCRARLPAYQVPAKVTLTDEPLATDRQKKRRRASSTSPTS